LLRRTVLFQVYDHTEASFIKTPKAYGRAITKAELPLGIAKYFPLATSDVPRGQGLPRDMLHQVLRGLVMQVEKILEAVRRTEMQMVGCSLLVIYEADWGLLRQNLQSWSPDPLLDEDGNADADADSEAEEDVDSDNTTDSDDDRPRPPYLAKLIDFGHTSLRAGAGPDMGVIMGLDTTIKLFGNRMEEVAGETVN
jgi:inositol-polyphosphate multikinase